MINFFKSILSLTLIFSMVYGQLFFRNNAFEKRFEKGVDYYEKHQFYQAYKLFERNYASGKIDHSLFTANSLMLIKSLFKLGDYDTSVDLIRDFNSRFPQSRYKDDLYLLLGEIFLKREEYQIAFTHFLRTIEISSDERVRNRAYILMGKVIDYFVLPERLSQIRDGMLDRELYTYLTLKLTEKLIREGDHSRAFRELSKVSKYIQTSRWQRDYNALRNQLKIKPKNSITIGIILPLSGSMGAIGIDILRGIDLYIRVNQKNLPYRINTIVLNNESDNLKTVQMVRFLARNPSVLTIIGPVSSENAVAAAGVASEFGIPLISPTATKNGIASLGKNIFQANADLELRGKTLAYFAVNVLGLKTFAILSPADDYGQSLTDAFAATVDSQGGEVVIEQWYQGNPENLGPQFRNIRDAAFKILAQKQTLSDTLTVNWDTTYSVPFVDYSFFHFPEDPLLLENEETKKTDTDIDSSTIILSEIEGIFIPIHDGDIDFVASQYAAHYLDSQLLGGGNWYDLKALNTNPEYVNGLIFISDYYLNSNDSSLIKLDTLFYSIYGNRITRIALYGYDTFGVVADVIKENSPDRDILTKQISRVQGKSGIIRNSTFNGDRARVNSNLFILQYRNKKIVPLYSIDSDTLNTQVSF